MPDEYNKKIVFAIKDDIEKHGVQLSHLQDLFAVCASDKAETGADFDKRFWFNVNDYVKKNAVQKHIETQDPAFGSLYEQVLLWESPIRFESFMLYMEKNRPYTKRFYEPRRKTLHIPANDLQALEDGKYTFYGLSMPSRVGKSSLCIFFLSWIALKRPNSHNAMGGHSGVLAKGFYKELLNIITSQEYTFGEIYKYAHPNDICLRDKSADEFTLTLGDADRFATVTCRGIDGTWTGAIDVSSDGYLYVDDLVRDRQHSLSPLRMEETYQEYLNKMFDRKNDGARELMVGTLWNVLDPLERLRKQYEGNPLYKFRRIPALNSKDESNFDYEINGFSTQYYRDVRERLDRAEWMAKYQQQPYVREGLLFPSNELRYFDGEVVDDEVVKANEHNHVQMQWRTIALCDPAFGGADSLSMPVIVDWNDREYVIDWVHKSGTQAQTVPEVVDKIIKHYVTELYIEQNSGGRLITDSIKAEMERRDCRHCRIVPYFASTNLPKAEKIKGYSDWVKEHFLFLPPNSFLKEDAKYRRSTEYQHAMEEVEMYTTEGKNPHDDAPDTITQLAMILQRKTAAKVSACANPFWGRRGY